MVCKNCGSEMNEKDLFCNNCGKTAGKEKKIFTLSIPEEKLEDIAIIKEDASVKTETAEAEKAYDKEEAVSDEKEDLGADLKEPSEEASEETAEGEEAEDFSEKQTENTSENEDTVFSSEEAEKTQEEEKEEASSMTESDEKSEDDSLSSKETEEKLRLSSEKALERKAELLKEKQRKKAKNSDVLMKVILCICAVVTVALTFVSGFTGVFRDDGEEKTVGLSILLPSDSSLFEETCVKYACLFEEGYNCEETNSDDLLPLIRPQSEGGLYAALYKTEKAETMAPDPAERYEVATAAQTKGYCKISAKKIGAVLASLSLENLKDINTKECYYYDGYYYFKAEADTLEKEELQAKVVSAKKTSEGNYYIVCDITGYSSKNEASKKYFLATLNDTDGKKSWSIRKISSEPLYDDFGNAVKNEKEEKKESLSFVMDRHVIEAKTKSGKLYATYIVEHPRFNTQGAAESAINAIYLQKTEEFEALAKKATKNYKNYLKKGGSKSDFPLYTVVSANVKLNDEGYFSLVEKTTVYNPLKQKQAEINLSGSEITAEEVTEEIVFPKTTVESYSFNIENGEFVKKDEVTGKDYLAVQQLLYRIWLGADDTLEDSEIPDDTDGIGAKIYTSPWVLTEDGLMFCYQTEEGYTEEITIPYNKLQEKTVMK